MIVSPSRPAAAIEPDGLAGVAAARRGGARGAGWERGQRTEVRPVAAIGAEARSRGYAGLHAELARQGGFARGGQLLTALIHHMGGAPTSAYRGMYLDTMA